MKMNSYRPALQGRRFGRKRSGGALILYMAITAAAVLFMYGAEKMVPILAKDGGNLKLEARAAILIDAATGKVLYAYNEDEAMPPASMSKMMTELIVLDEIERGNAEWTDIVLVSEYAAHVPGSRMGLSREDRFTVRELFDAMTIHSANDAAVALAEHIAGSEKAFAERMNEKGAAIGLSAAAQFGNASGLSSSDINGFAAAAAERETMLTAKDVARLAGYLIGKYPEVLEVASRSALHLPSVNRTLPATNLMLKDAPFAYTGNDGLKTGYTPEAGYCFTGTAMRDGRRLISVVMGAGTPEKRFIETIRLYNYGFKA